MKKHPYEKPVIQFSEFSPEDIITVSSTGPVSDADNVSTIKTTIWDSMWNN